MIITEQKCSGTVLLSCYVMLKLIKVNCSDN